MDFIQAIMKASKATLLDQGRMIPTLFLQGKGPSGEPYQEMIVMASFPGDDFTTTTEKGRYLFEVGKDFRRRSPQVSLHHLALVTEAWTAFIPREQLHLRDWKFVSQAPNRKEHLIVIEITLPADPTVFTALNPKKRYRHKQRPKLPSPPQRLHACEMIRPGGTLDLLPDRDPLPVKSDLLFFFLSGCIWQILSPKERLAMLASVDQQMREKEAEEQQQAREEEARRLEQLKQRKDVLHQQEWMGQSPSAQEDVHDR